LQDSLVSIHTEAWLLFKVVTAILHTNKGSELRTSSLSQPKWPLATLIACYPRKTKVFLLDFNQNDETKQNINFSIFVIIIPDTINGINCLQVRVHIYQIKLDYLNPIVLRK
jgi:hypothetical protein